MSKPWKCERCGDDVPVWTDSEGVSHCVTCLRVAILHDRRAPDLRLAELEKQVRDLEAEVRTWRSPQQILRLDAEARAEALEAECRRLAEKAKTAAARTIAEWGARQAMRVRQPTLAEVVMAAIDAALMPPEAQGREETRL